MRPAFASTKSAAAFALLLLVLLMLPALAGKSWLTTREQAYEIQSWGSGPYPWIHHVIFEEQGDIDIAFMGSSHIFHGIDTPYVQAELSRKLGRPAVVRTIGWGGPGYDALYFIAQDLLAHRKVHWLVFYDENNFKRTRNVLGTSWFRFSENAGDLVGLPWEEQGRFYLTALAGMPRNLLGLIRPNLSAELISAKPHDQERFLHGTNPATRLGSFAAKVGFNTADNYDYPPFIPFVPTNGVRPEDVSVYSPATKTNFLFSNEPLPAWQLHFARKLTVLASEHDTQLIMLHLPTTHEMRCPVVQERVCWPDVLQADVTLVGIPPAKLFMNLSDDDVRKLYFNWAHLNKNGLEFFTQLITPTLLHVYDSETKP